MSPAAPTRDYRADIDGLRAIAVMAVVIFHAFPTLVPGGFVGVDVFFVISGYLISKLILEQFQAQRFNLQEFYCRRANRIFPALLLVLTGSLAYGAVALLSDEYEQLGKHIAGGAAFVSNFVYLHEVDYFAAQSNAKPLLHLWSLSIEEQFYLVWPPLLWLAWSRRWSLPLSMALLVVVSFIFNVLLATSGDKAAFFLPQTRCWELVLGALLASLQMRGNALAPHLPARSADLQSAAGTALLVAGFLVVRAEGSFPGWWALLPALGTGLLIAAGRTAWINQRLLSNGVLVWLGLVSYPLYLWHWPILVFAQIHAEGALSPAARLAAVGASVLLAWLTYRWVEIPARSSVRRGKVAAGLSVALVTVGGLGVWGMATEGFDGFAFRQTDRNEFASYFNDNPPQHRYYKKMGLARSYRDECNFYRTRQYSDGMETRVPRPEIDRSCYQRDPGKDHVLFIWGDSHAQHLSAGLGRSLPSSWQVLQVASSACLPKVRDLQPSATDYCIQSNWFAVSRIAETKPDVVIVAQCCSHNSGVMAQTAARLGELGVRKVIFTGPVPHWRDGLPTTIVRRLWPSTPARTFIGLKDEVFKANEQLQKEFRGSDSVLLIDLIAFFCNKDGCLTRISDDRRDGITAWDAAHLTPVASEYLARERLVRLVTGKAPGGATSANSGP